MKCSLAVDRPGSSQAHSAELLLQCVSQDKLPGLCVESPRDATCTSCSLTMPVPYRSRSCCICPTIGPKQTGACGNAWLQSFSPRSDGRRPLDVSHGPEADQGIRVQGSGSRGHLFVEDNIKRIKVWWFFILEPPRIGRYELHLLNPCLAHWTNSAVCNIGTCHDFVIMLSTPARVYHFNFAFNSHLLRTHRVAAINPAFAGFAKIAVRRRPGLLTNGPLRGLVAHRKHSLVIALIPSA